MENYVDLLDDKFLLKLYRREIRDYNNIYYTQPSLKNFTNQLKNFNKEKLPQYSKIFDLYVRRCISVHYYSIALHICLHENLLDYYSNLETIPVVLHYNFEENYSIDEILSFFLDNIFFLDQYMKKKPNKNLMKRMMEEMEELEYTEINKKHKIHVTQPKSKKVFLSNAKKQFEAIYDKIEEYEETIWIERMKKNKNNCSLKGAPDHIKINKEIVKMSLTKTPKNLKFTSDSIKDSEDIIDSIFKSKYKKHIFPFMSERLRSLKKYALDVNSPRLFNKFTPELRSDKEIVLKFLGANPYSTHNVHKSLFHDKEVCLKLVSQISFSFIDLPMKMKCDDDILMVALRSYGMRIIAIPPELQAEKKYLQIALSNNKEFLFGYVSPEVRDNYKLILELLKTLPHLFHQIKKEYQNKESFKVFLENVKTNFTLTVTVPEVQIPTDLQMNQELLKYGMSFREENLEWFSTSNPSFLEGFLTYHDCKINQSPFGYQYQWKIEHIEYFEKKIYLFDQMYLSKEQQELLNCETDLMVIEVHDDAEILMKCALKFRGIYFSLVFDEKIERLKDLKVQFI
eukprot:gene12053-5549_t